jgi:hypothetical protein
MKHPVKIANGHVIHRNQAAFQGRSRAITIPARGAAEIATARVPRYFRFALRFAFFAVFFLAAFFLIAIWFSFCVAPSSPPPGAVASLQLWSGEIIADLAPR